MDIKNNDTVDNKALKASTNAKTTPALAAGIIILPIVLVALDQLTKYLAVVCLKGNPSNKLIPGVLELYYLENNGAAFSMLRNQQWFFYILTTVFLILVILFLIRLPKTRRNMPLLFCVLVLCAGGVGNFIDRVAHRYVIDFIYFSLIDFPVFNVADIYVTLGIIVLIALLLFHYKEDDFTFIWKKKGKED